MNIYDSVIIGAGPAGLSSAIYLARYNRSVIVVDDYHGRSTYPQLNENYLGFPTGIKATELRKLGIRQAKRFGAKFISDTVTSIKKEENIFIVFGRNNDIKAKSIIIATGVKDYFPFFPDYKKYIGISLFWCITCDGYKTLKKKVVVVGNNSDAVEMSLQFLNFTNDISLVSNCHKDELAITKEHQRLLKDHKISFYIDQIESVKAKGKKITHICLKEKNLLATDYIFNQQGCYAVSDIAKDLGVKTGKEGFITVDTEQHTNIPFVYAAGDVTRLFSHQIGTAVHEGSRAAESCNYDLYEKWQRL
jgi:thioredoxin reductase (NADPH)